MVQIGFSVPSVFILAFFFFIYLRNSNYKFITDKFVNFAIRGSLNTTVLKHYAAQDSRI